jgi:nitroimidazol reductase NimA-like FMN-containing flavoprotein (pyridoxamine 5'-phosphate oxidase superfamily)
MTSLDAANVLSAMERAECLSLLGRGEVGRLAVVDGGQPIVFPVNYVMSGEWPVFRTAPGTKLRAGTGRPVCFEVDELDRGTHTGWSVVVVGWLEEVTVFDPADYAALSALGVAPWADGERPHIMRVVPRRITGRRVAAAL